MVNNLRSEFKYRGKTGIARQLAGSMDVIEAGFPVASWGFKQFRLLPESTGTIICGLARANYGDIDRAWRP